jgi:hypothetical protein
VLVFGSEPFRVCCCNRAQLAVAPFDVSSALFNADVCNAGTVIIVMMARRTHFMLLLQTAWH